MLLEKLDKRIRKFIKRMSHNIFGPSGTEMLLLSRSNRAFRKDFIKTKSKIVAVTAKQLGMMDKVNPKDIENSFNELFKELKDNEILQNEIKKICGI